MNKYKVLIIIFLIFLSMFAHANEFEKVKTIKSFYFFDKDGNNKRLSVIDYEGKMGFKIGFIYFLTEKKVFCETIKNNKQNYKWNIYTRCNDEFLMFRQSIYVMSVYDSITNLIEFIALVDFGTIPVVRNIYFQFDRCFIKEFFE